MITYANHMLDTVNIFFHHTTIIYDIKINKMYINCISCILIIIKKIIKNPFRYTILRVFLLIRGTLKFPKN